MNLMESECKRLTKRLTNAASWCYDKVNPLVGDWMSQLHTETMRVARLHVGNRGVACHVYAGACLAVCRVWGIEAFAVVGVAEFTPKKVDISEYEKVPPNHCWVVIGDTVWDTLGGRGMYIRADKVCNF